jgi:hypothetical protein
MKKSFIVWCPELGLVCPQVLLREHWMNFDEISYEHPAVRGDRIIVIQQQHEELTRT